MSTEPLFSEHVRHSIAEARHALTECGYDTLILHAGTPSTYHADDQDAPYRSSPHFFRFVPLESPHHLLVITANDTRVFHVVPDDFWEEKGGEADFWQSEYRVTEVKS